MGIALRQTAQNIPTQVKNQDLVQRRRRQIVDAAVELFIQNGFHKTTTRQIAKAAGVSIGSLYEYVATKDDVLYLVCDAIHAEMERGMAEALQRVARQSNALAEVIRGYLLVCVANRARNHFRDDHRHHQVERSHGRVDDIDEPQQRVVGNEQMAQLRQAMHQLSYEQREVVLLHTHGQMTFTAIAENLGISANTAKSRYRYGIQNLRRILEGEA